MSWSKTQVTMPINQESLRIFASSVHHLRYISNFLAVLSVRLPVCHMSQPNSKTEKPRKAKIGTMEAHQMCNL